VRSGERSYSAYPGIGGVLYRSIAAYDYSAIEGIVFGRHRIDNDRHPGPRPGLPKIDPRISYSKS